MTSDYDSPDDTDRSEDEEEDERSHKTTLTDVKKEIRTVVADRKKGPLAEGKTRKVKLTEEDVDQLFEKFPNITQQGIGSTPTILHAIIDMVRSDEDENIESVTVKVLVQRLVQHSPHLLCIVNDENQNPLYLAIIRKKKILVDYMVTSCPQEDGKRQELAHAIEECRGNEQGKNCLHLALEKDMKPTTLLRMVKEATPKALEAVDITGKRPMHYAVQYQHCNIEVIRAFIDRDNELVELQKLNSPHQPTQTFLDVDPEKNETSVYNELVSSARLHNQEQNLKKETSDHKKKDSSSAPFEEGGIQLREQGNDAVKGRNATTQGKSESKSEPKPDSRYAIRPNHAPLAGHRDSRITQDQSGRPKDRGREKTTGRVDNADLVERERLREMGKEFELSTRQNRERTTARRDISNSRDRQSLGPGSSRDALRIQTGFTSTAETKPSSDIAANTPKLLKRVPNLDGGTSGDKPDKKVKQTATATKKSQKHVDHETAERVSRTVLRMLKLHYMRTRNIQRSTWWLYKTNPQDVQIFFDYHMLPSEIREKLFKDCFKATKFDEFLTFVHFTDVTVTRPKLANQKDQPPSEGSGRRDMEFFFDFLYEKEVRHILKVSVEENGQSVHSDESIKKVLDRITVEHLDWQKVDLDPQIICGISSQAEDILEESRSEQSSKNQLRRLDLQWSGNTAVLRAWSEPEGLPSLPNLQIVNIIVTNNAVLYDSPEWILNKKNEFEERLNKYSVASRSQQEMHLSSSAPRDRKVTVNLHGLESATGKKKAVGSLQSGPTRGRTSQTANEKIINTHEWLKCMDAFAKNIIPLWESTQEKFLDSVGSASLGLNHETASARERLENEVVVALIDDGVSLLDEKFVDHVLEGKTFDYSETRVGQSYNSAQGHGTEMARCILRVCPMAKIYPIRLKTHVTHEGKTQIDLESAALAIRAALEKNASIISMSWTIPVPTEHPAKQRFEDAVREASDRNVLMFCSSTDGGQFKTKDYPSAVQREKIFRIGAAHDHGMASEHTGHDVDFIFPGVKVNINAISPTTGSSVATALAAGLAATIIYCFKISVLAVKTQIQNMSFNKISQPGFTESALKKLCQHETMKTALGNIGWINNQGFIQIWDKFQPVVVGLEEADKTDDHEEKVRCIMNLCNQLVVL